MLKSLSGDFPILNKPDQSGKRLVYLDNAATTQKPSSVIQAVQDYYESSNANAHRGAYELSSKATLMYEAARDSVARFIHAEKSSEIIFTKGTTESLNLVAYTYGLNNILEGDEIVISIAEHHSNLIPWQMVAKAKGATLKYLYTNEDGILTQAEIKEKITSKTKIVAITHISNVLGILNPIESIVKKAHSYGAVVVLDAAQSVPHMPINVQELGVDFVAFSGHKMLAPMGIGVLYGRESLLNKMPPFLYGGGMVDVVAEQNTSFAELPAKFEGGTQNIEGAVGLQAAIAYIEKIGYKQINEIEKELTEYAYEKLQQNKYVTIYGDKSNRTGIISFNIEDVHPHDVSSILSADGVAIRSGHHCANPLMKHMGLNSTCRMSMYFYNTKADIDIFVESVANVRRWLKLESR